MSQIKERKQLYASNKAYIQKLTNMCDLQYSDLILETGSEFLECLYPENTPMFEYQKKYKSSKNFWNWFRVAFKEFENNFIQNVQIVELFNETILLTPNNVVFHLKNMIHDEKVNHDYYINFLNCYEYANV